MKTTAVKPPLVWRSAQAPLAQWYASALGQSIVGELQGALDTRLNDVFGYQGVQLGNLCPGMHLLEGAGLQRRLLLDAPGNLADVHGDAQSLPIASDSMKAVAFFHTLDFCSDPHQALREADRVLTDDGQLIIVGFNPMSLFGARHLCAGWRQRTPWNGRFYPRHRVGDWLSVLNYRVLDSEALFIRPPLDSERVLRRLKRLERLQPWVGGVGGLYVLRARKQTLPMTLARRHWVRQRAGLAASGKFARAGEQAREKPASVAYIADWMR